MASACWVECGACCTGWNGQTEAQCYSRGCCFSPLPNTVGALGAPLSIAGCFLPNAGESAYDLAGGFAPSGARHTLCLL